MNNKADLQINLYGDVFAKIEKLQANFANVINVVEKVDNSINKTVKNIGSQLSNLNVNAVVDMVRNVTEAVGNISAPGISFEKASADFSALTGVAGAELEDLKARSRELGISSGLGANGAIEAYKLLASQIQVDKIGIEGLNNLHKETITLAQASGMSMADAANSMAGTINQFGLEADQANRVINVLAAGSKYGAAEIPDLAQSFKVVGAAANAAGLNVEQTAAAIEVLSKNNLKGAEAGTALRNILLKMQTELKVDFKKTSLTQALDALKPKLNDATYLSKLFGMENIAAAQFMIANSAAVKEMTAQVTDTNVAQEQASITTETTAFKMQQWRAAIDDAKISMFDLMGSSAGFLTVAGEQLVMLSQMIPLFKGVGGVIMWFTKIENLQTLATGAVNIATGIWTGVQWALNAALWACPLTWIIAAILALVAAVVWCCTCVEGWGAQWDSVVSFMGNVFDLYVETVKYGFNTMIDGIMIGLDYLKLGWYKFKEACGLGDSDENQAAIAKINGDIEARQTAIVEGAKKIAELSAKTAGSLTWELGLKKEDEKPAPATDGLIPEGAPTTTPTTTPTPIVDGIDEKPFKLDFSDKKGKSSGSSSSKIDLDKIAPQDLKGSTSYGNIVSKISQIKMPSIATAAASLALPLAVATTTPAMPTTPELPEAPNIERSTAQNRTNNNENNYGKQMQGKNITVKACDKIEIHIASADNKGYAQIEKQIEGIATKSAIKAVNQIFDNEA